MNDWNDSPLLSDGADTRSVSSEEWPGNPHDQHSTPLPAGLRSDSSNDDGASSIKSDRSSVIESISSEDRARDDSLETPVLPHSVEVSSSQPRSSIEAAGTGGRKVVVLKQLAHSDEDSSSQPRSSTEAAGTGAATTASRSITQFGGINIWPATPSTSDASEDSQILSWHNIQQWLDNALSDQQPTPFTLKWTSLAGILDGHHLARECIEYEAQCGLIDEDARTLLLSTSLPFPSSGQSSATGATQEHIRCIESYLHDFDNSFWNRTGAAPWPSPIQIIPARIRLPGEQSPYRMEDGVSTTQPLRGPRRGNPSNTGSASINGGEGPSGIRPSLPPPPPLSPPSPPLHQQRRHRPQLQYPSSNPTLILDSSTPKKLSKGKGKAQPDKARPDIEPSKNGISLSTWEAQKQDPTWPKLQHTASCQQSDPFSQHPPAQSWMPQYSAYPDPYSPVMLPNNMAWQSHQGLFAQGRQHPSAASPYTPNHNIGSMAENSNSGPSSYWLASTSDLQMVREQAISTPNQNSLEFSHTSFSTAQENDYRIEANISGLTFDSSNSQPPSSPLDSPGNYSPLPPTETPGQQPQEHPLQPDIPLSWNYEPLQGVNKGQEGAGENDRWEDWVDFGVHPNHE